MNVFYKIGILKNFAKLTEKRRCRTLFLMKLQISIVQPHWKKILQYRCFLMNFAWYLKPLLKPLRPGKCLCSTEKYFTNGTVKKPLKKEGKKSKLLVKKSRTHAQKNNLNTTYHYSSYPFTIQKFLYCIFSLFPMIHWKFVFLETMQFHWRFICYRK